MAFQVSQWVLYHSARWAEMVEQGWVTWSVEYRGSDRYALMTREVR